MSTAATASSIRFWELNPTIAPDIAWISAYEPRSIYHRLPKPRQLPLAPWIHLSFWPILQHDWRCSFQRLRIPSMPTFLWRNHRKIESLPDPEVEREFHPQEATTGYTLGQLTNRGVIPNPQFLTGGNHFPLLLTVEQAVLVLHWDEFGPTILIGNVLKADELICKHRGSTNVSDFSHFDEINY